MVGAPPVALVVVDAAIEGDRRVLRSIEQAGPSVAVFDIREGLPQPRTCGVWLKVAGTLLAALLWVPQRYRLLSRRLGGRVSRNPFAGLRTCRRWLVQAVCASRSPALMPETVSVHAHDLYSALAVTLAGRMREVRLIYDVHELEIHRNRRAGWPRVLIEHALEQWVLTHAHDVRVVNQAIADVMAEWYRLPVSIQVDNNDHFRHHRVVVPPAGQRPALVYVGQGVNARHLEDLDLAPEVLGFDVRMYLLGASLTPSLSGKHWQQGPVDYETDLLEHVRDQRSLMWCCVNPTSLSYELATPNKFFQALAAGIPVVASEATYLADIVKLYDLGPIYTGDNLSTIREAVLSSRFAEWVSHVERFRGRLRCGEVTI